MGRLRAGDRPSRARGWAGRCRRGGYAGGPDHPDRHQPTALRDPACDQARRAAGDRGRRPGGRRARLPRPADVHPAEGRRGSDAQGHPERDRRADRRHHQGAAEVSVLVVAEHLRGQVRDITYELIAAGLELGGPVAVAAIGSDPGALDLKRAGVEEIVHVRVAQEDFEGDIYQQAVEALIVERRPDHVLVGFTVNSLGYAPAIAAKLGLGFASDVFAVRRDGGTTVAIRAFYGSKVHAELEFPGERGVILMLRPTIWP